MSHSSFLRVWLSVFIGFVAVAILFVLTPNQGYKPKGIFLPAKINRPARADSNIPLYANVPGAYHTLGHIHIMRFYTFKNSTQSEQAIIDMARRMAAEKGANAVIVKFFGHSIPGLEPASQATYQFKGLAIYTNFLPSPGDQ